MKIMPEVAGIKKYKNERCWSSGLESCSMYFQIGITAMAIKMNNILSISSKEDNEIEKNDKLKLASSGRW